MSSAIHVLLIEDNPGDAELTRETLEAGKVRLELSVAADGAEALAMLRNRAADELPDLILLDLNLPKLSGQQILAELKRDQALRRIPVVVLTSSDADIDVVKSYELGASCYVTKPVGLEAFQTIVRAVEHFWFTVVRLP